MIDQTVLELLLCVNLKTFSSAGSGLIQWRYVHIGRDRGGGAIIKRRLCIELADRTGFFTGHSLYLMPYLVIAQRKHCRWCLAGWRHHGVWVWKPVGPPQHVSLGAQFDGCRCMNGSAGALPSPLSVDALFTMIGYYFCCCVQRTPYLSLLYFSQNEVLKSEHLL